MLLRHLARLGESLVVVQVNLQPELCLFEKLTRWIDRFRLAIEVSVFLDDKLSTSLLSKGCCDSETGEG